MDDDFKVPEEIMHLARQLNQIAKDNLALIKPDVDHVIRSGIKDERQIERLLDILLDLAGMNKDALALFKHLCRHYYGINPQATAEYVYFYRDLYDSKPEEDEDTLNIGGEQT